MERTRIVAAVICTLSLLVASQSLAQGGMGRGRGQGRGGARMYDPKTVETISGEVVDVQKLTGRRGRRGAGVHMTVKTDKETIAVHLGPAWYMKQQALKLEPKDHVEVRGSRITFQSKPAIIASEVKKGDQTLKLRDDTGRPEWRGLRPKAQ